jgi:hypothetical protein
MVKAMVKADDPGVLKTTRQCFTSSGIQGDQKENKSEQALQFIGHVVAEFYANKRSMHGRR